MNDNQGVKPKSMSDEEVKKFARAVAVENIKDELKEEIKNLNEIYSSFPHPNIQRAVALIESTILSASSDEPIKV